MTALPYFCGVKVKLITSAIADCHNLMLYKKGSKRKDNPATLNKIKQPAGSPFSLIHSYTYLLLSCVFWAVIPKKPRQDDSDIVQIRETRQKTVCFWGDGVQVSLLPSLGKAKCCRIYVYDIDIVIYL